MAHIPLEAKWYGADLVVEIVVQGDSRNVAHKNTVLVRADSPEEAYAKALVIGRQREDCYENPAGKRVQTTFRGLSDLNLIDAELDDGTELFHEEKIGVPSEEIQKWILPKEQLNVFRPVNRLDRPDYSSKEIMKDVARLLNGTV